MNKKQFIKELEHKLEILDEQELKDTINEYKDIIDEKVKSGLTEEEAVLGFGPIDELSTEILKAYKINPKKVSEEEVNNDFEEVIKKGANRMAEVTKDFFENVKDNNLSVELIFEIIIKFILLLVALSILRLPFHIIESLGSSILDLGFYPLDEVLGAFWKIITGVAYLVTCVLIFIVVFKPYFKGDIEKPIIKKNEKMKKEETKEKEKPVKETKKRDIIKETSHGLTRALKVAYQIFMIMVFLVPLFFVEFGLCATLAVLIAYFFMGIRFFGSILVIIALIIGTSWAVNIVNQLTFGIKKLEIYPVFISISLLVFGGVILSTEILNIDYKNELPKNNFEIETYKEVFDIKDGIKLNNHGYYQEFIYVENNQMPDNKIEIETTYYKEFGTVSDINLSEYNIESGSKYYELSLVDRNVDEFNAFKKTYKLLLNNLKNKKIYNYDKLDQPTIKIIGNSNTINKLKQV